MAWEYCANCSKRYSSKDNIVDKYRVYSTDLPNPNIPEIMDLCDICLDAMSLDDRVTVEVIR